MKSWLDVAAASGILAAGFYPLISLTVRWGTRMVRRRRRRRRGGVRSEARPRAPGAAPVVIDAEFIEE